MFGSELALYYSYTGDPTNILGRYHEAVLALVNQMRAVRAKALRLPRSDAAFGMPTGNTVDDLYLLRIIYMRYLHVESVCK